MNDTQNNVTDLKYKRCKSTAEDSGAAERQDTGTPPRVAGFALPRPPPDAVSKGLGFGFAQDGGFFRTDVASQSIPSLSPNPFVAEQLWIAHLHVSASDLTRNIADARSGSKYMRDKNSTVR